MEVRIDTQTQTAAQTKALGIDVGDFVAFDPRVEIAESGLFVHVIWMTKLVSL